MPLVVKGYRVSTLAHRVWQEILEDNVLGLAAQTAYFFFFSLFPLLLFITPIIGLVLDARGAVTYIERQMARTLPPETFTLITGIIEDVVFSESAPGIISIGALLALWAGSNVFNTLANALNRAYDVEEGRPWWKTRLMAFLMVLLSGVVLALAFTTIVAGERIITAAAARLDLTTGVTALWTTVQYTLAVGFLILLAWLTFWLLPNVRQHKGKVLVGAVFTSILWLAATFAFRAYVVNFANYNRTYGTIGAIIILLTWMYISMLVVLIGGELTSELHKGSGLTRRRDGTLYGRIVTGGPARASME